MERIETDNDWIEKIELKNSILFSQLFLAAFIDSEWVSNFLFFLVRVKER